MKRTTLSSALGVLVLAGLAGASAAQQPAAGSQLPEQLVGIVAGMQGRGGTTFLTMHIDSTSTDEEVKALGTLLKEKGQEGVVAAMFKMDRGWLKLGPTLGYTVAVVRSTVTEHGRRLVLVTERPIQLFESRRHTRSVDYPFGIIELSLDADGKGTGKLIAAAQARFNADGTAEIVSLGAQPYEILQVHPEKAR